MEAYLLVNGLHCGCVEGSAADRPAPVSWNRNAAREYQHSVPAPGTTRLYVTICRRYLLLALPCSISVPDSA
eukprot:3132754-Rhodomonas_salina.2